MAKTKNKQAQTRIALQLPADLDAFFVKQAQAHLLSKSALIRSVLLGYRQEKEQTA